LKPSDQLAGLIGCNPAGNSNDEMTMQKPHGSSSPNA
jgi:hypothetical protein